MSICGDSHNKRRKLNVASCRSRPSILESPQANPKEHGSIDAFLPTPTSSLHDPVSNPNDDFSEKQEKDYKRVCIGSLHLDAKLKSTDGLGKGPVPVSYRHGQLSPVEGETDKFVVASEIGNVPSPRIVLILSSLVKADNVSLEFFCRRQKGIKGILLVNVCTVPELVPELGTFFDKLGLFLQDPIAYIVDLPYNNPHLLSHTGGDIVMLSSLNDSLDVEHFSAPTDIFDDLLTTDELPEASTPTLLSTPLLSHQRQALHFMLKRERSSPSGGLLADQMGLGKTLQMISLIASDHEEGPPSAHACGRRTATHATLIIVPLSLLATWTDQFAEHVAHQRLSIYVHYGADRSRVASLHAECDVVLTTYDVVAAEFRKLNSSYLSLIFSKSWRRVILDEAHLIKNPTALRTNAIVEIESVSRWAVTGTPIQNRLSDLAALFRFLRYFPYDDPANFRRDILEPWKTRLDVVAVQKLRLLLQNIAIRRSKDLLHLPKREDRIRHTEFTPREAAIYEQRRAGLQRQTLEADPSDSRSYPHVLRWIDGLREFCSRGEQSEISGKSVEICMHGQTVNHDELRSYPSEDSLLDDLAGNDQSNDPDFPVSGHGLNHTLASDGGLIGFYDENLQRSPPYSSTPQYAITPKCSGARTPSPMQSSQANENGLHVSSKVSAMLGDITNHSGKCVVFSYWRSTLDVAGHALDSADIRYVRIDGQMNKMAREDALKQFRQDHSIKAILATISVAAVGLDLTVANLVCLLEPQWNPSVEEQALSRVHRMRQKLPVTTVRYVARNSIEESILELQKRKLRLAQLALSGEATTPSSAVLDDLRHLLL